MSTLDSNYSLFCSLVCFAPSSIQYTSRPIRSNGRSLWTPISRSLQRCSAQFSFGLWLSHKPHCTRRYSKRGFEATSFRSSWLYALGYYPAKKGSIAPVWAEEHFGAGINSGDCCTLLYSFFPLTNLSVAAVGKSPKHNAATIVFHFMEGFALVMTDSGFLQTWCPKTSMCFS